MPGGYAVRAKNGFTARANRRARVGGAPVRESAKMPRYGIRLRKRRFRMGVPFNAKETGTRLERSPACECEGHYRLRRGTSAAGVRRGH